MYFQSQQGERRDCLFGTSRAQDLFETRFEKLAARNARAASVALETLEVKWVVVVYSVS